MRPALLLELRVLCAAIKEIAKRALQMAQPLLQRDTGHFLQPGHLFLLLQRRQGDGKLLVVEVFLALVVGIRPGAQPPIVDIAHTAKSAGEGLSLLLRRIAPIFVGALLSHA